MLENWKIMEHKSNGETSCFKHTRYRHERIGTMTGELGNNNTNGDQPNNSIVEIGHITKKNPGDLKRLANAGGEKLDGK